ncbi:hypothetical protein AHMF7605_08675 [Adhaeribacter arboris]|uniref:Uncharacterized protein n=1 Tax=Adhaeribacter arboris TaxID=2072846 RepID=A0A2T2YDL5_9BACT|nr:hypothetical protein AHMF7605_08675 [Adhaeribacter arboris]
MFKFFRIVLFLLIIPIIQVRLVLNLSVDYLFYFSNRVKISFLTAISGKYFFLNRKCFPGNHKFQPIAHF